MTPQECLEQLLKFANTGRLVEANPDAALVATTYYRKHKADIDQQLARRKSPQLLEAEATVSRLQKQLVNNTYYQFVVKEESIPRPPLVQ